MSPLTKEQQKLVTDNIGIAITVLQRLRVHRDGWEEARDEAYIGLCLAAQSFDPSQGCQFSTWAWRKVRWHVIDWMRKDSAQRHLYESRGRTTARRTVIDYVQQAKDLDDLQVCERDVFIAEAMDTQPLPDEQAYNRQVDQIIRQAIADAPRVTQDVVTLSLDGLSKTEAADKLNVSSSTVVRRKSDGRKILQPLKTILAKGDDN